MPIVHWNRENAELKDFLKEKDIPYWLIASYTEYSEWSITQWMRKPLAPWQAEIINQAVNEVLKSKEYVGEPISMVDTNDLHFLLKKYRVSQAEIAKRLFVTQATVSYWMRHPNPQRREEILEVIKNIREERRLSI